MKLRWLCLLFFALCTYPVFAQDLVLRYTFENGMRLSFPLDWHYSIDRGLISISSEATQVFVLDSQALAQNGIDVDRPLLDVLQDYLRVVYDGTVAYDENRVDELVLNGHDGYRYTYDYAGEGVASVIILTFTDGTFGILDSIPLDTTTDEQDTVLRIAVTFDRDPAFLIEPSPEPTNVVFAQGSECTIRTEQADAVRVHVGPGLNRTALLFLPAGQDFQVFGQAYANDYTLWWKLDRAAVAPKKTAAEAWVSQADVVATGECATVPAVQAPPIIPIVHVPQGDSNAPSGKEIFLQSGTWTIIYPNYYPASCLNIPSVNVPLNQEPIQAELYARGDSVYLFGQLFTRTERGRYEGSVDFLTEDKTSVNATATIFVGTSNNFKIEYRYTYPYQGYQCSHTIYADGSKN